MTSVQCITTYSKILLHLWSRNYFKKQCKVKFGLRVKIPQNLWAICKCGLKSDADFICAKETSVIKVTSDLIVHETFTSLHCSTFDYCKLFIRMDGWVIGWLDDDGCKEQFQILASMDTKPKLTKADFVQRHLESDMYMNVWMYDNNVSKQKTTLLRVDDGVFRGTVCRIAHLKPVAVVHLLSDVRRVRADGELYGGTRRKPPPLHPKRHEAGTQHCSPHVHIQVGHVDVWLPGD